VDVSSVCGISPGTIARPSKYTIFEPEFPGLLALGRHAGRQAVETGRDSGRLIISEYSKYSPRGGLFGSNISRLQTGQVRCHARPPETATAETRPRLGSFRRRA
jgi:hypothetical protein